MASIRQALEALEWVRREVLRVNAPDQMRNGMRERGVQKLCAQLLRGSPRPAGERLGRRPDPRHRRVR